MDARYEYLKDCGFDAVEPEEALLKQYTPSEDSSETRF